jgi:hypothetical protein
MAATLTKKDRKAGLRRINMIEIMAPDYDVPVAVCYRLQPVLRPSSYRSTLRVVTPDSLHAIVASSLLSRDITPELAGSMLAYSNIYGE